MAEKKPYMVGNVRLSDLNGFEDTVKQGVRGCFIPYDQNPSLYIGANRQTGALTVDMDILIRETRSSKSGSSHYIKLSVGKANRERFRMNNEAVDSLKIVGNLYTRTPGQAREGVHAGPSYAPSAPQAGYQGAPAPIYAPVPPQGGYGAPSAPQGGGNGAGW